MEDRNHACLGVLLHVGMLLVWLFDISVILLLQEGKALKQLATAARLDIEDFLQKKVFLEVPTDLCTQIVI